MSVSLWEGSYYRVLMRHLRLVRVRSLTVRHFWSCIFWSLNFNHPLVRLKLYHYLICVHNNVGLFFPDTVYVMMLYGFNLFS